jgi:hypothetical protein
MNDLTIRFLKVYNYLLDKKIVNNPSRFSKKINISTSMMNEILKGRVNAGINPIQNIVNNFPQVNPAWLLTGKGAMILDSGETTVSESETVYEKHIILDDFSIEELIMYIHKNEKIRNFDENETYKMFLEIRFQRNIMEKMKMEKSNDTIKNADSP